MKNTKPNKPFSLDNPRIFRFKLLFKPVIVIMIISISLLLYSCQPTADEHFNKAMEFAQSKNFSLAVIELDKAIELNPNFAKAYLERGKYRFNLQYHRTIIKSSSIDSVKIKSLFKSSINDFTKAMELDSALMKDALVGRGHAFGALKDYKNAVADFEEVIKKDETNKQLTWFTIHLTLTMKDTVGAKLLMDRIISLSPNDAENYYVRATYKLTAFNDKIGACEDLNRAKELFNENEKYLSKNLKAEIEEIIKINCTK